MFAHFNLMTAIIADCGMSVERIRQGIDRSPRPTAATYSPHWHTSWHVVDKGGDLFGTAINVAARLAPKATKRFLVPLVHLLDGPLPHRADARAKSLVKAIISPHIYSSSLVH